MLQYETALQRAQHFKLAHVVHVSPLQNCGAELSMRGLSGDDVIMCNA